MLKTKLYANQVNVHTGQATVRFVCTALTGGLWSITVWGSLYLSAAGFLSLRSVWRAIRVQNLIFRQSRLLLCFIKPLNLY